MVDELVQVRRHRHAFRDPDLPIPAGAAAGRAERLLEAASGDPWAEAAILQQLSLLYGYAGRVADARAAYRRGRSIFTASGARFDGALCAIDSGRVELIARNHAAAPAPAATTASLHPLPRHLFNRRQALPEISPHSGSQRSAVVVSAEEALGTLAV